MRNINSKSSDIDSFKYSILISLHYYDISFHLERKSKLKPDENKYNFIHIAPTEFETNNSNISLTIFDEKSKKSYTTKNDSTNKAHIVQLKNNRYAALKPSKNKFMRLHKMLKPFLHKELKEYILNGIHTNDVNNSNDANNSNDSNETNDMNNINDLNGTNNTNVLNGVNNSSDVIDSNDVNDSNK